MVGALSGWMVNGSLLQGSTLKKKSPGRNSIALRLSEATVRSRALRLLSLGPFEGNYAVCETELSKPTVVLEAHTQVSGRAGNASTLILRRFINILGYLTSEIDENDKSGEMSPGPSTDSYPAFAHIGLRENPGKHLSQACQLMPARASARFREPKRFTAERKETDERGGICRLVELYSGMASTDSIDKGKRTF
ncbi:hypothetical protein ANN_11924 [Periplaneta americana]|uniref:Uncharacterized protein n=1 Tax=Periplaneta americana TaxID=6978 RepID=A0ABQ8T728_PERAM|nr:hypothetical protein ANN_11924 [Periplaneta americana]